MITGLRPIKSLSYWRYTRMKKCQISGAYPFSVCGPPLPRTIQGRAQLLGVIFHSLMESFHMLASNGNLNAKAFRHEFTRVLENISGEARSRPSSRHLGDPRLWPELTEIYRNLTDLIERKLATPDSAQTNVYTEKTLYSNDRLLFGQIDAFFIQSDGIDLVDYKSGSMVDEELPKEDYANQLYFYAYLIHQVHGIYPRSLALVGKDSSCLKIQPSPERSETIAREMKTILSNYNEQIKKPIVMDSFANPNIDNCVFCDAKPVCESFWKALPEIELPVWAHVAIGTQIAPMVKSKLGGASIELMIEKSSLRTSRLKVTRIFEGRHPEFQDKVGQRILITNLRQLVQSNQELVEATERSLIFPIELY